MIPTPVPLVPWINIGDVDESVVWSLIEGFIEFLGRGASEIFRSFESWFVTMDPSNIATNTAGPFIWGEPTGCVSGEPVCALGDIRGHVYFGEMTALALVLVLLFLYFRAGMSIFGVGSRRGVFRTRRKVPIAFALIVAWYPITVAFIALMNELSTQLLGDPTTFGTWMGALADSTGLGTGAIDALPGPTLSPISALVVAISGLFASALYLVFTVRIIAIWLLLFAGPIVVALAYSGVPRLDRAGRKLLKIFVGLALLPVGVAIAAGAFMLLFRTSGGLTDVGALFTAPLVLVSFEIIALYFCWRMVRLPDRVAPRVSVRNDVDVREQLREVVRDVRPGAGAAGEPVRREVDDAPVGLRYRRTENEPGGQR